MRVRRAFTLVELLVVVGLIAVLVALLMPSLVRAREQMRMTQCLSNLRQLGMAMVAYVGDNDGRFPRPAAGAQYEDWFYYQGGRDPDQSRIAKYLVGGSGHMDLGLLRCPSDDVTAHPWYPYSYTVNEFLCRTQVLGNMNTMILRKVLKPSETIMIIDESAETIDDGCWAPQNYFHDGHNLLSNRHDRERETSNDPNAGRGCVAFADGHAAFIPRLESTQYEHFRAYPSEPDYNSP